MSPFTYQFVLKEVFTISFRSRRKQDHVPTKIGISEEDEVVMEFNFLFFGFDLIASLVLAGELRTLPHRGLLIRFIISHFPNSIIRLGRRSLQGNDT